ncbi:protein kinase domain-containing protein [Cellulomonas soli]|uniref:serine/threonine-protein kinase n=1 Tax=Cellulomonas soli TaxID=931535 RepID=UPI003F8628EA
MSAATREPDGADEAAGSTLVGRTVLGRYRLGRPIGAGGTADVHVADDLRLGTTVAVKVHRDPAPGGPGADPTSPLRRVAHLRHPHVVEVTDLGVDLDGRVCVVMQLVDGCTVDALLADARPLPVAHALALADAVLDGLEHAHAHGVLHLDLSPGNVMLPDADPRRAVVLDLGGTTPRSAQADGWVTVSPSYASPEIATGAAGDARSDVYGVGCLLLHALTGQLPYPSDHPEQVLAAHVHRPAPVPSSRTPGLPAGIDRLVARALRKDPQERFASVGAMRAALREIAGDHGPPLTSAAPLPRHGERPAVEPGPTRTRPLRTVDDPPGVPTGAVVAPPPPVRRSRLPVLLTVVVLAGLAVGGAVATGAGGDLPGGAPVALGALPTPTTAPPSSAPSVPPAASATPSSSAVVIPVLDGADVDRARAILADAQLTSGDVLLLDGPGPARTVLRSEPPAGTQVGVGAVVGMVVASGMTAVPDVVGLPWVRARELLVGAGLGPVEPAGSAPDTVVRRTEPAAGTRMPVGGSVAWSAAPPVTAAPSPSSVPSPSNVVPTPDTSAGPTPTATPGTGPGAP